MFRVLVLQTLWTLSDDQAEYQLRDRLSFMRFAGLSLADPVPDAKTIWLFREQLVRAGAFEQLFERFDAVLRERGFLAMGGQIVDATIVEARRPRLSEAEKAIVKGGGTPEDWRPARTRQVDRDGRWTLKRGRKRPAPHRVELRVEVVTSTEHVCGDSVGLDPVGAALERLFDGVFEEPAVPRGSVKLLRGDNPSQLNSYRRKLSRGIRGHELSRPNCYCWAIRTHRASGIVSPHATP